MNEPNPIVHFDVNEHLQFQRVRPLHDSTKASKDRIRHDVEGTEHLGTWIRFRYHISYDRHARFSCCDTRFQRYTTVHLTFIKRRRIKSQFRMKLCCICPKCVAVLVLAIQNVSFSTAKSLNGRGMQNTDTDLKGIVKKRKTVTRRARKLRGRHEEGVRVRRLENKKRKIAVAGTGSTKAPSTSTKSPRPPSRSSTRAPVIESTEAPTFMPSSSPSMSISIDPTMIPSNSPTNSFSNRPSALPSVNPSINPTSFPSRGPTIAPTSNPTSTPTSSPTSTPTSNPTSIPTSNPTSSPSSGPTSVPSSSPTIACVLKAELGFPDWEDPDEADYFGYHTNYLEVWYNATDYCDAWTSKPWCTYENSNPGSAMSYVSNIDDYYWPEELLAQCDHIQEEQFTIRNAQNKTTNFNVYHVFEAKDYYPEYETWNDHMMAPILTITSESTGEKVSDENGNVRWHHPVDKDIRTHTEEGEVNPEYQGDFGISVTCDNKCECSAHGYTTEPDNFYYVFHEE